MGKVRGDVEEGKGRCGGVKKCGGSCARVYGVTVEKCVEVWEGKGVWGKVRGDVGGKEVWG